MSNGIFSGGNFADLLSKYVGETVTIFTTSGGQSGSGFTGVILSVNPVFVRLITRIGPPPGCSLGNACTGFRPSHGYGDWGKGDYGMGAGYGPIYGGGELGAGTAGGWDGYPVYTLGSVADIPIANIVSFVHNAV
ncbi:MAG: hypothetical protein ACOX6S_01725 [Clostridia bacterium]|jgi:S1-C subfamily serine protease